MVLGDWAETKRLHHSPPAASVLAWGPIGLCALYPLRFVTGGQTFSLYHDIKNCIKSQVAGHRLHI